MEIIEEPAEKGQHFMVGSSVVGLLRVDVIEALILFGDQQIVS